MLNHSFSVGAAASAAVRQLRRCSPGRDIMYNIIIDSTDVVNIDVFKRCFPHVNNFTELGKVLTPVYINLPYISQGTINIYTKYPPNYPQLKRVTPVLIEESKFELFPLFVTESVTLKRNILSLRTMDSGDFEGIWETDPALTKSQNCDILIQMLFGKEIVITTKAYLVMRDDLALYKRFKLLSINKDSDTSMGHKCGTQKLTLYDLNGFNLLQFPS